MITIEVKNKEFKGERCGIDFVNGVAKVETITPEQRKFFKEMGYTVTGNPEKKTETSKVKTVEQMNKEELLVKAKELEIVIENAENTTKAQIIEMIKAKETPQE